MPNQFGSLVNQYHSGAINEEQATRQAIQRATQQGMGIAELSSQVGYSPEVIRDTAAKYGISFGNEYGLQPAESAIGRGVTQAKNTTAQARGRVSGLFGKGIEGLTPFIQPGQQANNLQAALSGALGPEAQQKAFAEYQQSPGVAFAQEEGERAILRNASALGGLSSGNVMDELNRRAVGTYMQDFDNQFGRLGDVATRGLSAASNVGGLRGQEAGIQAGLDQNLVGMQYGAGRDISNMRYQTGRDVSSVIGNTSSALANLVNQQGAGQSDIVGNGANNINQLIQLAMSGDANAMEQLGVVLGNVGMQGSSSYSSQPFTPFNPANTLATIGQVASGIGGLAGNLPPSTTPATPTAPTTPTASSGGTYNLGVYG